MSPPRSIILSRTDNLGDVMLTLPMAGLLKERFPGVTIYFLGKSYTRPLIEASRHVDGFLDREAVLARPDALRETGAEAIVHVFPDKAVARAAKRAGIPLRIGTSHRLFHLFTCNRLVNLSRKHSDLHESQLNIGLLQPLGIAEVPDLSRIGGWYGMRADLPLPAALQPYFADGRFRLILHPKSKGSAREWPPAHFLALARGLDPAQYRLFVTGTAAEGEQTRLQQPELFGLPHVVDLTGKVSLAELVAVISHADGLVACSTGPLHVAAAMGKLAVGIYPPIRPMHPGRWGPVGPRASYLVLSKDCSDCRKSGDCACVRAIAVQQVSAVIVEGGNSRTGAPAELE
ncbi:MAG: glycosyltransferase family 9 protein [Cytophagales bacterium]|nr:glycosyltransferase family 9 protein [Cytophagales bacterium]